MKNAIGLFQNREYNPISKRMNISEKKIVIHSISSQPFLYELSDSMIDPLLKFIHHKDLTTVGWIKIKKGKYDIDYDAETTCDFNYSTRWTDVKPINEDRDNTKIKTLCLE